MPVQIKIKKEDILNISYGTGFNEITLPVERDFLLNIIIYEIYNLSMGELLVFKGGTALKKVYFGSSVDRYRFSKDLDFNIIKDISIDRIEEFIDELVDVLDENYGLRFERIGGIGKGDYGNKSYAIKIKLKDRGYIFNENVRIKFDFAIRPGFKKPYSKYKIINHYKNFFDKDIYCLSEDIDVILYDKFLALVGPEYRTEPKDFFDIVELIDLGGVSDEKIEYIINQFNPILSNERINKIISHWKEFFNDQLSYIPDINYYIKRYDEIIDKFYNFE